MPRFLHDPGTVTPPVRNQTQRPPPSNPAEEGTLALDITTYSGTQPRGGKGIMTRSTSLLIGALSIFAATASAAFSREDLLAAAKTNITAQTTEKIDGMKLATDNFTYQENNKAADIKRGVLSMALTVNFSRSTADTTACASYTNIVALPPKPYVLATQNRHANNDPPVISMVDTIAATTGALFFNPTKTLGYVQAQDWSVQKVFLFCCVLLLLFGVGFLVLWFVLFV